MTTHQDDHPLAQQKTISGYLSAYGVEPDFLERLIASLFRDQYPHLTPGAPSGGPDLGMDIMHTASGGETTVWCVTVQERPWGKLRSDAIRVLRTFGDWPCRELSAIYLCTCRKFPNKKWQNTARILFEERDKLVEQGVAGIQHFEARKCDCDSIALELTTQSVLSDLKKELLERIREGLGVPRECLEALGCTVPGNDDEVDDLSEIPEEAEPTKESWSILYRGVLDECTAIEQSQSEERVLSGVESIGRFVASTKMMGRAQRDKDLPAMQVKLDQSLWPKMASSWERDHFPAHSDVRIAACFVHLRLALQTRSGNPSPSEVDDAYKFLVGKARERCLPHHYVIFKLAGLLTWLLHRGGRHNKVLQLLEVVLPILLPEREGRLSHEEYILSLNLASLYIHAAQYREGDQQYRKSLATVFQRVMKDFDEGYWRKAFALLALLYEHRTSLGWAETREQFLKGFEQISAKEVNTPQRALTYLRLHGVCQELSGRAGLEVYQEKIDLLKGLVKRTGDHPRLRVHQLRLELGAVYVAPWYQLCERFLDLEGLIRRMSSILGDVNGLILKLRFLRLFLVRVCDPRVLQNESFVERSAVVSSLLGGKNTVSLDLYFGIGNFNVEPIPQHKEDAHSRMKPMIRPLIFRCLSRYATTILPNMSLPTGVRVSAAFDYLDFLSQAEVRSPEVRISTVFRDMLDTLEEASAERSVFHCYLARFCFRHSLRDIPKAVRHFGEFWAGAGDLEKSRFASDYARALYENFIYFEEETGNRESLPKLLELCGEFLSAGSKRYFISCYYGLALSLQDPYGQDWHRENKFLAELADRLCTYVSKSDPRDRGYYDKLLHSTIYTTRFHEFLTAREQESYVAASLIASLNSPEIYNAVGTHIVHLARSRGGSNRLLPAKLLYDIAVGLAHGNEFYVPKYQFNRTRCDIIEIELAGGPKKPEDVQILVSAIGELHRMRFNFIWTHRYLKKDLCEYLYEHRDNALVRQVLDHPDFERWWHTLRAAYKKKVYQGLHAQECERGSQDAEQDAPADADKPRR